VLKGKCDSKIRALAEKVAHDNLFKGRLVKADTADSLGKPLYTGFLSKNCISALMADLNGPKKVHAVIFGIG
jgi:hypothetical protein